MTRYNVHTTETSSINLYDSTVTINNNPTNDNIHKFVNTLLELLIKAEIITTTTAGDILATFGKYSNTFTRFKHQLILGIKGINSLEKIRGNALKDITISTFKIMKDATAAAKFTELVKPYFHDKSNFTYLVVSLLQLLLDNGEIDKTEASILATKYSKTRFSKIFKKIKAYLYSNRYNNNNLCDSIVTYCFCIHNRNSASDNDIT